MFATELQGLPVLRVIVTHMHPDHIGLAHWLTERWQAPLQMTMTDYSVAHLNVRGRSIGRRRPRGRHFARHGLTDPEQLEACAAA